MASTSVATAPGRSAWDGGVSPMGASYGKLMMWFFLLSDAFTFSALLVTYGMVRSAHQVYTGTVEAFKFSASYWPIPEKVFEAVPFLHGQHLPLVFVGLMTFILIMSSVTMVLAVEAGHRMDKLAVQKWMLWTILGGLTFLGCQAWEWTHFIVGNGTPTMKTVYDTATGAVSQIPILGANLHVNQYGPQDFADFFFFITGFHGFHVFSGVCLNFLIYFRTVT